MQPLNDNKTPEAMGDDELLYLCVKQLCSLADLAKTASEIHAVPMTDNGKRLLDSCLTELHKLTRGLETKPVLSRMVVVIAAAAAAKHMVGATLTVQKGARVIHLKGHYGPGRNDWHDLMLSPEVAEQLRDGLTTGLEMLNPKIVTPPAPKLIM